MEEELDSENKFNKNSFSDSDSNIIEMQIICFDYYSIYLNDNEKECDSNYINSVTESTIKYNISNSPSSKIQLKPFNLIEYNSFMKRIINKLPVVRIYGTSNDGKKIILNIHQYFPYFYIKISEEHGKFYQEIVDCKDENYKVLVTNNDIQNRKESILYNFALLIEESFEEYNNLKNQSLNSLIPSNYANKQNNKKATVQVIHDISICKKIDFYGYNEEEETFLKICVYDFKMIKDLMKIFHSKALMNMHFQCYEAHLDFNMHFFSDFNLYGMGQIKIKRNESFFRYSKRLLNQIISFQSNYDEYNQNMCDECISLLSFDDEKNCYNSQSPNEFNSSSTNKFCYLNKIVFIDEVFINQNNKEDKKCKSCTCCIENIDSLNLIFSPKNYFVFSNLKKKSIYDVEIDIVYTAILKENTNNENSSFNKKNVFNNLKENDVITDSIQLFSEIKFSLTLFDLWEDEINYRSKNGLNPIKFKKISNQNYFDLEQSFIDTNKIYNKVKYNLFSEDLDFNLFNSYNSNLYFNLYKENLLKKRNKNMHMYWRRHQFAQDSRKRFFEESENNYNNELENENKNEEVEDIDSNGLDSLFGDINQLPLTRNNNQQKETNQINKESEIEKINSKNVNNINKNTNAISSLFTVSDRSLSNNTRKDIFNRLSNKNIEKFFKKQEKPIVIKENKSNEVNNIKQSCQEGGKSKNKETTNNKDELLNINRRSISNSNKELIKKNPFNLLRQIVTKKENSKNISNKLKNDKSKTCKNNEKLNSFIVKKQNQDIISDKKNLNINKGNEDKNKKEEISKINNGKIDIISKSSNDIIKSKEKKIQNELNLNNEILNNYHNFDFSILKRENNLEKVNLISENIYKLRKFNKHYYEQVNLIDSNSSFYRFNYSFKSKNDIMYIDNKTRLFYSDIEDYKDFSQNNSNLTININDPNNRNFLSKNPSLIYQFVHKLNNPIKGFVDLSSRNKYNSDKLSDIFLNNLKRKIKISNLFNENEDNNLKNNNYNGSTTIYKFMYNSNFDKSTLSRNSTLKRNNQLAKNSKYPNKIQINKRNECELNSISDIKNNFTSKVEDYIIQQVSPITQKKNTLFNKNQNKLEEFNHKPSVDDNQKVKKIKVSLNSNKLPESPHIYKLIKSTKITMLICEVFCKTTNNSTWSVDTSEIEFISIVIVDYIAKNIGQRESYKIIITSRKFDSKISFRKNFSRKMISSNEAYLDNTELINVFSEIDLILKFCNIIHDNNPDFIFGYETEKLSIGYIIRRGEYLGIDVSTIIGRVSNKMNNIPITKELQRKIYDHNRILNQNIGNSSLINNNVSANDENYTNINNFTFANINLKHLAFFDPFSIEYKNLITFFLPKNVHVSEKMKTSINELSYMEQKFGLIERVSGRVIVNLWRILEVDVKLTNYSFENMIFNSLKSETNNEKLMPIFDNQYLYDSLTNHGALDELDSGLKNSLFFLNHLIKKTYLVYSLIEHYSLIERESQFAKSKKINFN